MDGKKIPTRRLYPVPEACELLGNISHSGFYRFVSQGVIHLVHIGNRAFVTDDEIDNIVARIEAAERRETENRSAEATA